MKFIKPTLPKLILALILLIPLEFISYKGSFTYVLCSAGAQSFAPIPSCPPPTFYLGAFITLSILSAILSYFVSCFIIWLIARIKK